MSRWQPGLSGTFRAVSLAAVLLVSLALCPCGDQAAAAEGEPETVTCKGRVVDSDGSGVGGAEVVVYQPKGHPEGLTVIARGTTAHDGAFFLEATRVSEYMSYATAWKEGLAHGWNQWHSNIAEGITIRLGKPSVLAGKVVDETGAAIAGAQVRAFAAIEYPDDRRSGGMRHTSLGEFREPVIDWLITSTDSEGRFTLKDIPEDARAFLIVKASGHASVWTKREKRDAVRQPGDQYVYSAGQTDIVVELPPEAVITGRIFQRDTGEGVGGIELRVTPGVGDPYPVSAEDGAFRVGNLAAGEYTLMINPTRITDRVAEPVTVKVAAGETVGDAKISLFAGALLEVHITDARSGEPIEGANVSLRTTEEPEYSSSRQGKTETDGVAEVRLLPGKYALQSVWDPDRTYQQWRSGEIIEVADGEARRIQVALTPRLETFAGVVRDAEGKPVEGAVFRPVGGALERGAKPPRTDESGRFSFRFEPWPGEIARGVTLFVRQRERGLAARFDVTDTVKQPFEITLRPAPGITGKVTDPDGRPIAGASVQVTTRRGGELGGFSDVAVTRDGAKTGEDGGYTVAAIPPGFSQKYQLDVRADGYARRQMAFYIDDTNPVMNEIAPIALNPANASISGIVVDSSGDPVAGARVSATGFGSRMEDNSIQWQPPTAETTTDAEGKFTLAGVTTGRLTLIAHKDNPRLHAQPEIEAPTSDARIVILTAKEERLRWDRHTVPARLGKVLPGLEGFGIEPAPGDLEGKRVLVCLWDYQSRPSRALVEKLANQADALSKQGLVIVCIHAGDADAKSARKWARDRQIALPLGAATADIEKVKWDWGVRALPWLVLADGGGIVRAEGFRVEDLGDILGGLEPAAGR